MSSFTYSIMGSFFHYYWPVIICFYACISCAGSTVIVDQTWWFLTMHMTKECKQHSIDYVCGAGEAYCSSIQLGGSCCYPNNVYEHTSYAFNFIYQKQPQPISLQFGGCVMIFTQIQVSVWCILYDDVKLIKGLRHYDLQLLTKTVYLGCEPRSTPMNAYLKLSQEDCDHLPDPLVYQRLIISRLFYFIITRSNLSFSVTNHLKST